MEGGEISHQSFELMDDVLDVLVIQQLQLHQHIGSEGGKPLPGVGTAPQNQPGEEKVCSDCPN